MAATRRNAATAAWTPSQQVSGAVHSSTQVVRGTLERSRRSRIPAQRPVVTAITNTVWPIDRPFRRRSRCGTRACVVALAALVPNSGVPNQVVKVGSLAVFQDYSRRSSTHLACHFKTFDPRVAVFKTFLCSPNCLSHPTPDGLQSLLYNVHAVSLPSPTLHTCAPFSPLPVPAWFDASIRRPDASTNRRVGDRGKQEYPSRLSERSGLAGEGSRGDTA